MAQNRSSAVMAQRIEPPDSLDFFPTPPWATRALMKYVMCVGKTEWSAWDPACGQGHMSAVLDEYFDAVYATDIFEYRLDGGYPPCWYRSLDFLSDEARQWRALSGAADWIITNPPFKVALDFTIRALEWSKIGVAMLVRTQWLESHERYRRLFEKNPPTHFAPFVERVPMVKGCWDPKASTATSYAWFVWYKLASSGKTDLRMIPPGCRTSLTLPNDIVRFGKRTESPLGV